MPDFRPRPLGVFILAGLAALASPALAADGTTGGSALAWWLAGGLALALVAAGMALAKCRALRLDLEARARALQETEAVYRPLVTRSA